MSLLSKIKNTFTGEWAELHIECGDGKRGEPLAFKLHCAVGADAIAIKRVYVQLAATKTVEVDLPDGSAHAVGTNFRGNNAQNIAADADADGLGVSANGISDGFQETSAQEILFETIETLLGPQELEANHTYTWAGSITLPADIAASGEDKLAVIEWGMLAGLDMPGNDPDSGWKAIAVS